MKHKMKKKIKRPKIKRSTSGYKKGGSLKGHKYSRTWYKKGGKKK